MINQAARDYLSTTNNIRVAHLIEIELAGTDSVYDYLTDYQSDVTINGKDYLSGKVTSVGDVRLTQGLTNYKVTLKVPAEFQEELDKVTTNLSYEGRRLTIYRAYIKPDGSILDLESDHNGPLMLFQGKITSVNLRDPITSGSSSVTWECAGLLQDFEKNNGRLTDDAAHRGLVSDGINTEPVPSDGAKREAYKTDTGFLHSNQTVSTNITYLTMETEYYLKKSWLGLKNDLKTREVEVEKELELNTSLTAKYLPIVYGVRRVPGIPIFADALQNNPDRMVVVYAVCEGEIESFLNVYVDGISAMCGPGANSEEEGVCMGNMGNGDTLAIYSQNSTETVNYRDRQWTRYKYDRDFRNKDDVPHVNIVNATKDNAAGTDHGESINIAANEGAIRMAFYHGKPDQTPDPFMVNTAASNGFLLQNELTNPYTGLAWGPEYWAAKTATESGAALLDTAYVVAEFDITEDRTTIPELEFIVSGRKCRVFTSPGVFTWEYTLNPVWHLMDYLVSDIFGGELNIADLDTQSFIDVAARLNTEDTSYEHNFIKMWRYIGWRNPTYSRAIMQCNTLMESDKAVTKNAEKLLEQFKGSLVPSGERYELSVEDSQTPVANLSIGDLTKSISINNKANKDKWNSIQASIQDPALNWTMNQVSFFNSTFLAEDNNIRKKGRANFDNITNYYTARSWAEYLLNTSRFSKVLNVTTYYKYFDLMPNDNVTLTYPRYGFVDGNNLFRIKEVNNKADGSIDLTLERFDVSVFDLTSSNKVEPPDTTGSRVAPPSALAYVELPDSSTTIQPPEGGHYVMAYWNPPANPDNILRYELVGLGNPYPITVQATNLTTVSGIEKVFTTVPVERNSEYVLKVLAVDRNGNKSAYSSIDVIIGSVPVSNLAPINNFDITNSTSPNTFFGSDIVLTWDYYLPSGADDIELEVLDPETATTVATYIIPAGNTSFTFAFATNKGEYLADRGFPGAYRRLQFRIRGRSGTTYSAWSYLYDNN